MGTIFLTLLPLFWAVHVAVTRVEDYVSGLSTVALRIHLRPSLNYQRHHKEDVVVGSLIGILSATVCYLAFWPSPLHSTSFVSSSTTEPRNLYNSGLQPRRTYELTQMDEDSALNTV